MTLNVQKYLSMGYGILDPKEKTGLVVNFVSRDHALLASPTFEGLMCVKIRIFENFGQLGHVIYILQF